MLWLLGIPGHRMLTQELELASANIAIFHVMRILAHNRRRREQSYVCSRPLISDHSTICGAHLSDSYFALSCKTSSMVLEGLSMQASIYPCRSSSELRMLLVVFCRRLL